jgi:malate dehydrogenase (oxaloacetate-decarboxylating)(NADP+)
VLIGRDDRVLATLQSLGLGAVDGIEVHNARLSGQNAKYVDYLYAKLQRRGYLQRDVQRMVNQDRNIFAALMVATGDAAAMVTGITRAGAVALRDVLTVIDPKPGSLLFGLTLMVTPQGPVFFADTAVNELPTAEETADIAVAAANAARSLGVEPRVALLSYSTFGNPMREKSRTMRDAMRFLEAKAPDFEFDGEMSPEVALDHQLMRTLYPFCRLKGPANVLVMPGLHSAHIVTRLAPKLGGVSTIGPLLIGLSHPVQIVPLDASVATIVEMACLAAHETVPR